MKGVALGLGLSASGEISAAIPCLSLVGARAAWSGELGCRLPAAGCGWPRPMVLPAAVTRAQQQRQYSVAAAAAGVAAARCVIANGVALVSGLGEEGAGDSAHEAPVEGPHPPGLFSGRGQRRGGVEVCPGDVCSVFTRARSPAFPPLVGLVLPAPITAAPCRFRWHRCLGP